MAKKKIVLVLSVIALLLSIGWFIAQPGYEPAITFFVGLAGVIGSYFMGTTKFLYIKVKALSTGAQW